MVQALSADLELAGDCGTAGEAAMSDVAAALAPRYTVGQPERARRIRRVWLDTFDWQLHRSGLTLEQAAASAATEVRLAGADGAALAACPGSHRWPAMAGDLPPGPLRSAVAPVSGIRALLPVARATSVLTTVRVLNADAKTVAWLTLDRLSAAPPAGAALPARLSVSAVRGYQADALRIQRRLTAFPGLARPAPPALTAVLAAAGRRPEDYSGKVEVELAADMPGRAAMAQVLLALLDMLEANVPGTVRDIDTEFLHDLRVSVRRTRSALKLTGDVLPDGLAARFRPEFKWLGDATTPTRDLDVYLMNLPAMAERLTAFAPADLAPLRDYLTARRTAEQRRLARVLRSARFAGLARDWRAGLTHMPVPARAVPAGRLAAGRIRRAHRRVLAAGGAITPASPPEALHDLRKRCKELRYALEFFASLHESAPHREVVGRLKGLQDCLGEFQDRQVQRHALTAFAAQMMAERDPPATALLAMGDLAGHLAQRQRRARDEFATRFADFASLAVRDQMNALPGGGRR